MFRGVAIDAAASIAYVASRWDVACSASTLLMIVPELDQPIAASLPSGRPPSRVRRRFEFPRFLREEEEACFF